MISRTTLLGALVVVELAILGAAGQAIAGGHQRLHEAYPALGAGSHEHRHFGMVMTDDAHPVTSVLDKTFQTGAAPHVVLDVDNAKVSVQAGDATDVRVAGTMRVSGSVSGATPSLTAVRTSDGVRVSVESGIVHGTIEREVRLTVPPDAEIEIASAAAVESSGLRAKLVAHLEDGSVRIVNHRGDVDVTTASGDIELLDVQSTVMSARTEDGKLHITSSGADRIDAHTASGDISAVGLRAVDGTVATEDGGIDVTFAPQSDAAVNLHTADGSITGTGSPAAGEDSAATRTMRLGSARGSFTVSTVSGSITVSQGAKV